MSTSPLKLGYRLQELFLVFAEKRKFPPLLITVRIKQFLRALFVEKQEFYRAELGSVNVSNKTVRRMIPQWLFISSIFFLSLISKCLGSETSELVLLLNDPFRFDRPQSSTLSDVGKALVKEINRASTTIDFALYGIRDQDEIHAALLEARKRGVKIRGIVDMDINEKNYYTSTPKLLSAFPEIRTDFDFDVQTAIKKEEFDWEPYCEKPNGFEGPLQCIGYGLPEDRCLVASHASREPLSFQGDIMHNKFFVIDKRTVWTGSTNASDSGTGGYNANNAILVRNGKIADWFTQEFEQMFLEGRYHRSKTLFKKRELSVRISDEVHIDIAFSPQSYTVERLLRPLIKGSELYIDIPVFFLTHKKLTGDLIAAHQRGVKVRIIIDATAAKNGYTKHEILRAAGIQVKVESWGGKMHMKSAVIDGKYMVVGSMNWTSAGERDNDENTQVVYSKKHAEQMHSFFNQLWNSIPDKWLRDNPDPESLNSGTSCFDGVDNDFDQLADSEDPGCSLIPSLLPALPPYNIVPKIADHNLVKGNISKSGKKIYQVPGSKYYRKTKIDKSKGEKWFCSVYDAREHGWKSYREY